jgi:hypothetical protein
MASTVKSLFGGTTAITCTLASLASGSARESTAIDNTSNLYIDAALQLAFKLQAGAPSGDKVINVYVYGSVDGTNYSDNATGADAAVTLRSPTNLIPVLSIQCPDAGALTYKDIVASVAAAFPGGILPPKWGIVIENKTGVAFSATEGDHTKQYRGIHAQNV